MDTAANPNRSGTDGQSGWQSQAPAAIIEFILDRYHEPLRRDLPGLVERAHQVEAAEQGSPLCPKGLGAHLEQVRLAVESHLSKEEKILFPLILAGRGPLALMPIRVMMSEHDDHLQNLEQVRSLTHGYTLPATVSPAWRELYRELQQLEDELGAHIDLENNVLFTRVLGGDAR
jgi:regulator of cell morphogenesis and NO signaling